jgi:hypothetical protein
VPFRNLTLDELTIDDERSFRHVALYHDLKQALRRSGYRFRVAPAGSPSVSWDRALFLNLTFWDASESGDVLVSDHIAADVVAHVAWHDLARRALDRAPDATTGDVTGSAPGNAPGNAPNNTSGPRPAAKTTADGLFLGESIASAFDLYLVGRLLGHSPDAEFLETQVPAMAEAAEAAGLSEEGFEALLASIAGDPERAFEDLRELLFDAVSALFTCRGIDEAAATLDRLEEHRFAPLLHHYELSNWILYARAYAPGSPGDLAPDPRVCDPRVRAIDAALRSAPVSLDWLEERWVRPALSG